MLTLSRKDGQQIVIVDSMTGERIVITAIGRDRGQSKIGLEGSQRFRFHRGETVERFEDGEPEAAEVAS